MNSMYCTSNFRRSAFSVIDVCDLVSANYLLSVRRTKIFRLTHSKKLFYDVSSHDFEGGNAVNASATKTDVK